MAKSGLTQIIGIVAVAASGGGGSGPTPNEDTRGLTLTVDGGGAAITTGVKGYLSVPFSGTLNSVVLLADVSGSAVVDVWKSNYSGSPPTVSNTITASAYPTLAGDIKYQDTSLTGWTTAFSAGDVFGFNVRSASTVTRLNMTMKATVT